MYNNIGGKIKGLAVFFCILGILGSLTVSIVTIVGIQSSYYLDDDSVLYGSIGGVLISIVGSLISWVSSFLLYGFGQLVQNSDRISTALNKQNRFIDNNAPQRFGTYQNPAPSVPNQPYGAGGGNAYGSSDAWLSQLSTEQTRITAHKAVQTQITPLPNPRSETRRYCKNGDESLTDCRQVRLKRRTLPAVCISA